MVLPFCQCKRNQTKVCALRVKLPDVRVGGNSPPPIQVINKILTDPKLDGRGKGHEYVAISVSISVQGL